MIHLSFSLPEPGSPWWRTWEEVKRGDSADLAEIDLRYKYFGVNVEMVVGGVEVISKRRFVTLVDLALSLSDVGRRISSGEDAAFGFTESEEVIHLRCDGDLVAVTSSKRPWRVTVECQELVSAFSGFLREVYSYCRGNVTMTDNPSFGQGTASPLASWAVAMARTIDRSSPKPSLEQPTRSAPEGAAFAGAGASDAARFIDDAIDIGRAACSFTGDTRVLMADGTHKPIKDVEIGDQVLAADPETGNPVPQVVRALIVHQDTVLDLVLSIQGQGRHVAGGQNYSGGSEDDPSVAESNQSR